MPFFMDRHEAAPNATSFTLEEVAARHDQDVLLGPQFGVRWITYYLDPFMVLSPSHRIFVRTHFCIAEAQNREMVVACHRASHGSVPSDIREVDWQTVEKYLGSVGEPAPAQPWEEPALRAILVSEVASGSAASTADSLARAEHERICREAVLARGGLLADGPDSGVTASFVSAAMAIECATAILRTLTRLHTGQPEKRLHARIGLSAGQPYVGTEDLFDSTVRTARSICAVAQPDTILVSGLVRDLCAGKTLDFADRGEHLVGVTSEPVRLFSVGMGAAPDVRSTPAQHRLSDREVEVIRLIAAGRSNQQIADELVISYSTVVRHVANIFDKTDAKNRTEAAAYAFHLGLA